MLIQNWKLKEVPMSAPLAKLAEPIGTLEPSRISCRDTAAQALAVVRDGVITGEGPTTKGRVHFSRALDAFDAAWCVRILTASAVDHQPISRAEAEALSRSTMRPPSAATTDGSTTCWPRRWCTTRPPRPACRCRRAGGIVARYGDRKTGRRPRRRRQHRSAGVDREPDARQAPQQPHAHGAGRHIIGAATLPLTTPLPNVFDIGM